MSVSVTSWHGWTSSALVVLNDINMHTHTHTHRHQPLCFSNQQRGTRIFTAGLVIIRVITAKTAANYDDDFFTITEWHSSAMIELWSRGHEFNSWAGHGCVTTLGKLFVSLLPRAYLGTSKSWDANSQTGTPTRQQHHSSFESHHRWLYTIRDAISGEKVYNTHVVAVQN